jgi:hypothetical protein
MDFNPTGLVISDLHLPTALGPKSSRNLLALGGGK